MGGVHRRRQARLEVDAERSVDVAVPNGHAYRDAVLFLQEEDAAIGAHVMPYRDEVEGPAAINYGSAPLAERLLTGSDPSRSFDSTAHGDPATDVLDAHTGDAVRLRVLLPSGGSTSVDARTELRQPGHRGPRSPSSP